MSRLTEYGLLAVVGMGFSTIASVQAGDPLPVVAPAVTAGGVIAISHVREHRRARDGQEATDDDVEQAVADVEPDDRRGDRPDRAGRRDDRRDDQGGDPLAEFDDTPDDGDDPLGMFEEERPRRSA